MLTDLTHLHRIQILQIDSLKSWYDSLLVLFSFNEICHASCENSRAGVRYVICGQFSSQKARENPLHPSMMLVQ